MIDLDIKLDEREWRKVERMMRHIPRGLPRATARAVNKTLTGVRTDSVKEIRRVVNLKAKTVRDTMTLKRAIIARPWAKLTSRGKRMGLGRFGARQTKKGVTAQIFKNRPRFLIPRAYMWKGLVLRRTWVGEKRAEHRGRKFRPGFPYGKLPEKYRLPVYRLRGPSVPFVMGKAQVFSVIRRKALERLNKNFAHEVRYLLMSA